MSFRPGIDEIQARLAPAKLLLSRLERLSADSHWAHRASGLRGALLRYLELIEAVPDKGEIPWELLDQLVASGFEILEQAARDIRPPDLPV